MKYKFTTADHPEADGREWPDDAYGYVLNVKLDDKGEMSLRCGKQFLEGIVNFVNQCKAEGVW